MCSDALGFDSFYGVSKTNRKVAERDANRVIEAYASALANLHFAFKRDFDIVLIEFSRGAFGNFGVREYTFNVFEKGTNTFVCKHKIQL